MKLKFFAGALLALSLAAPALSKSATYEVGALQVEQQGKKGPAVILIPGLASGTWVWTDTVQRLQKDHTLYLLTLPGFDGRAPVAGATLDTLVGDIRKLIESKQIARPVLVGHSLGGRCRSSSRRSIPISSRVSSPSMDCRYFPAPKRRRAIANRWQSIRVRNSAVRRVNSLSPASTAI